MTVYEQNMQALEKNWMRIRNGIDQYYSDHPVEEQVMVGDALDGEKFMVICRGDNLTTLNSTYHPSHEAMRFVSQFDSEAKDSMLFLYGFGNGEVIRRVLSDECPIGVCIIYEPSVDVFRKALEEYDLQDVLLNDKLVLMVENVNADQMEQYLDSLIDYQNWRKMCVTALTNYQYLYPDGYKKMKEIFLRVYSSKQTEMNTIIFYAQRVLKNEIKAMKWIIESKTLDSLMGKIPTDIPCIVVAAGPSLEKNVEVLRQAKGKAFIICVDSAITYLMGRGIEPDLICTVDPGKSCRHFNAEGINRIPIAVLTESAYAPLELMGDIKPIYVTVSNTYFHELFKTKGHDLGSFNGGGSVATVCFHIATFLGFKNIIIIGQDLAYSGMQSHAGRADVSQAEYDEHAVMVDGYYGEKVMSRSDFKYYIDWYNLHIAELKDTTVINSTEGGAKLLGTVQMPLQEAVNRYCNKQVDIDSILDDIPQVWNTREDKKELYLEFCKKGKYFTGFQRKVKDAVSLANRAVYILKRGNFQAKELKDIDKKLQLVTKEIEETVGMDMLVNRIAKTDIESIDDLYDAKEDVVEESARLYEKMKNYLSEILVALDELVPEWKAVLQEINERYEFE